MLFLILLLLITSEFQAEKNEKENIGLDVKNLDKEYEILFESYSNISKYAKKIAERHFQHVKFLEEKLTENDVNRVKFQTYSTSIFCLENHLNKNLMTWIKKFKKSLNFIHEKSYLAEMVHDGEIMYGYFENVECLKSQHIDFICKEVI